MHIKTDCFSQTLTQNIEFNKGLHPVVSQCIIFGATHVYRVVVICNVGDGNGTSGCHQLTSRRHGLR